MDSNIFNPARQADKSVQFYLDIKLKITSIDQFHSIDQIFMILSMFPQNDLFSVCLQMNKHLQHKI